MNHLSFRKTEQIQENRKFKDQNDLIAVKAILHQTVYFSYVKKAIRDADWTYHFLHM